ncbi:MAG: DNA mismatch repair protein MutL [Chlamydiia bacterium]|nr:DNA mismatch repair protein MutL [Chlamydiia bacterium]
MSKIRLLNENTINQIAAGEVIENPASVVKELVENAIDAGASQIAVEIRGGGFALICICDDGSGMSKEDALLCFERHATSKIKSASDLFKIASMGFRGEALASIGSIAKVELSTSTDGLSGHKVVFEGGNLKSVSKCSRQKGTTFDIRSLFYNVPARKKFQKSAASSISHIHKMLIKVALAFPHIGFTLTSDSKQLLQAPPSLAAEPLDQYLDRANDILGKKTFEGGYRVNFEENGLKILGIVGDPSLTRTNRTGQYLLINQRACTCPLVQLAVQDAYGTRIPAKEHPTYLLYLTLPTDQVDVNVHPQKKEVRLSNERVVLDTVRKGIGLALLRDEAPQFRLQEPDFAPPSRLTPSHSINFSRPISERESIPAPGHASTHVSDPKIQTTSPLDGSTLPWEATTPPPPEPEPLTTETFSLFDNYKVVRAIGEEERLYLVDWNGLIHRLRYDEAMQVMEAKKEERLANQKLLFPETMHFEPAHIATLQEVAGQIHRLGFDVTFEADRLICDALPGNYDETTAKQFFESLLSEFDQNVTLSHLQNAMAKRYALKSAAKGGRGRDVQARLTQFLQTGNWPRALDGKELIVEMDSQVLAKLFDRGVSNAK